MLVVALFGLQILIPYESSDLNCELQLLSLSEIMSKISLLVGIIYAVIFQEGKTGAITSTLILALS